ncbi:MAG TPA: type IV-A pilus assembly ATPase PilB [Thermodesulfovibrio thiophilus]|uniref:type IV-A pilus assembly ATPase PilB n=1 Tax=Thermodesulfovibrio thiophilus TaxID=340095 RepID=UPI0017C9309D|nr:type IV-A pilus assembly ATPase PilB [Thermodesulfovibrio thiophilus]HHW19909.1 type IV-A pilus assembly ATPase PilB [Thermodesulfovibrio thiophilus]HQD35484.1 type IV-A pilus assembly ATPase PilB [Thermodesulfovibrio thiophilus]
MALVGATSLGQYLVKKGVISEGQLLNALKLQKSDGIQISAALIKLKYLTEDQLFHALSEIYGYRLINLLHTEIDINAFKLIPEEVIKKYKVVPFAKTGNTIKIAICNPSDIVVDHLKFLLTGFNLEIYLTKESEIMKIFEKFMLAENDTKKTETVADLVESALGDTVSSEELEFREEDVKVEAPIIKLANKIIVDALKMRASDIHVEPYDKGVSVRYRIDGVLHKSLNLPLQIKSSLITRLKIMAHLDISEKRLPQDGRIKLKISNREVDFRVSTLPIIHGEKIVLRILEKGSLQLDLTKLGFEKNSLDFFLEALQKPYGMILVTGPTGSGKTTTLYSALMTLNKPDVNIMTVEDPVEYSFPGINQVQVKEEIGLTFASALRSFLRQDPDIIMVGEIRDFETAEIAVKSALTGHLVLSTLHTNDAASTVTRLVNMGIEPFLISSSVILIMAQRLVRKLCPNCKKEEKYSKETLLKVGFSADKIDQLKTYRANGCSECNNTGYSGRVALYEVMPIKDEMRELILTGAPATEIKREAINIGMTTLRQSGINKVIQGITSVEEVLRITFED